MGNFYAPSKCPYKSINSTEISIAECWAPCCSNAETAVQACCNVKDDWTIFIIFIVFFTLLVNGAIILIISKIFCPEELDKIKLVFLKIFNKKRYEAALQAQKRREARKKESLNVQEKLGTMKKNINNNTNPANNNRRTKIKISESKVLDNILKRDQDTLP